MLAVGTMPETGGGLQYQEICSYATGEMEGTRLDLEVFLPLRAYVESRFPAAAQLSAQQLLLVLTYATLPWPVDLVEPKTYVYNYDRSLLEDVACEFKNVERMEGYPGPPPPPFPERTPYREQRVPEGMDLDNSCRMDGEGYERVHGLPFSTTLTKEFCADLYPKLALVTDFHLGRRR